jgi:hypothetical protein
MEIIKMSELTVSNNKGQLSLEENNQIVEYKQPPSSINLLEEIKPLVEVLHTSGYFPDMKSTAQGVVKALFVAKFGIDAVAAQSAVHVITAGGKVNMVLSAQTIATIIKTSRKYDYIIREKTAERCIIEFFQNGQSIGCNERNIQWAKKAGLASRSVWQAYTEDMLFARCISSGARQFAPDVFLGQLIYTEDEVIDIESKPELSIPPIQINTSYESKQKEPSLDFNPDDAWLDDDDAIKWGISLGCDNAEDLLKEHKAKYPAIKKKLARQSYYLAIKELNKPITVESTDEEE